MRKLLLYLLPVCLLLAASCNMEKRLYRDGWYKGHPHKTAHVESGLAAETLPVAETELQSITEPTDTNSIAALAPDTVPVKTGTNETVIDPIAKMQKKLYGDPVNKGMSYTDAMASMAKKGCTPNRFAKTIYLLSIISIAISWLSGIGIFLALITLLLSIFAIDRVIAAGGECVEENLAIIKAAQRNCWIFLLVTLLLAILLIGFILVIVYYFNGF